MSVSSFVVNEPHIIPHGSLLEGITYDDRTDTLYYLDIPSGSVFILPQPSTKRDEIPSKITVDDRVGVIGLTTNTNKLLCGIQAGVCIADLTTGEIENIDSYPNGNVINDVQFRSNDGSVGPDGSFWLGTMDELTHQINGSMWFLKNKDSKLKELWKECIIPNGMNWDPARGRLYWTDTGKQTIYKFNYNFDTFELDMESKTPYFQPKGNPDGSCIDKDGNLYVALWGSGKVVRVNTQGEIDMEWKFPSRNISCCIFGDNEFKSLYVTSASLDKDDLPDPKDLGAAVYRVDVSALGIQGLPKYKFKL